MKRELKREGLKSDLNKAFKGQSIKKSEPCPLGACFRTKDVDAQVKLKSENDRKRDRKRNLVPAKTGLYILILMVIYTIIPSVLYISFSDLGTRAYILSLAFDFLSCIIVPGLVVFQAPLIRRKINKVFSSLNLYIHGNNSVNSRLGKGLVFLLLHRASHKNTICLDTAL